MEDTESNILQNQQDIMNEYKEWKQRRRLTTIIGYVHTFMIGLEYTSVSVSGLYYYKDDIRPSNPKLFYGISMAAFYVSAIFANPILGKMMDQTRQLRTIMLSVLLLNVLGNFVYTISFSSWFPIVGRLLCGVSEGCVPVMSGSNKRNVVYSV